LKPSGNDSGQGAALAIFGCGFEKAQVWLELRGFLVFAHRLSPVRRHQHMICFVVFCFVANFNSCQLFLICSHCFSICFEIHFQFVLNLGFLAQTMADTPGHFATSGGPYSCHVRRFWWR